VIKSPAPVKVAALAGAALALVGSVSGCAQFDKELGQQWIVVTFAPNTSVATARHVTSVCSHIPNLPLMGKVQPDTGEPGVVDEVNFNSTHATDAETADLQQCLQKFPKIVQGFTQTDEGDS
jgi:hypothetical protein